MKPRRGKKLLHRNAERHKDIQNECREMHARDDIEKNNRGMTKTQDNCAGMQSDCIKVQNDSKAM